MDHMTRHYWDLSQTNSQDHLYTMRSI